MTIRRKVYFLSVLTVLIGTLLCCGKYYTKQTEDITPVHFKTATELTETIQNGDITSVELLDIYVERIQRYNKNINAVVALNIEEARKRASEADKALAQGQYWGPLHGLPITIKDVIEVTGMPTASGDPALKDHIPKHNAIAVQRLIDAGAIVFGKTNVPFHAADFQSFNEVYGTTNNPWDLSKTPGGSSGGSAAALSAGFTSLELGSDIGGSIRFPSHYTGVYGHKTTFGIVPRYGHIPPMPGKIPPHIMPKIPLFVFGPLSRSAEDLELALEILTSPGKTEKNISKPQLLPPRKQNFGDYRVAVWFTDSYPAAEIDADVLASLKKAVDKLRGAGLHIDEEARPDFTLKDDFEIWWGFREQRLAKKRPGKELIAKQKDHQLKWADFFKRYDILLTPVALTVAFPHDHSEPKSSRTLSVNGKERAYLENICWTACAVVSGLPATVAPVGLSESGHPVGIQIISARLEDRTTIAFAKDLSKLIGGFEAPPDYKD